MEKKNFQLALRMVEIKEPKRFGLNLKKLTTLIRIQKSKILKYRLKEKQKVVIFKELIQIYEKSVDFACLEIFFFIIWEVKQLVLMFIFYVNKTSLT